MSEHRYIPGHGNQSAKILILTECPTYDDLTAGKLMSRHFTTKELLKESGINPLNCWITSVSKYFVPPNVGKRRSSFDDRCKENGIDLQVHLNELQVEINGINPNLILGLGKSSLYAATGRYDITSYRGSILNGFGKKFIPTYNPEHLNWQASDVEFKGYYNRQIMSFDFRRSVIQSQFPDIRRPNRILEICNNSAHLSEFLNRWKHKQRCSVDIEAHGTYLPACIGFAFDKSHGMSVPLWNIDNISSIPTSDLIQCWIIINYILNNYEIVGANFNYDRDKIKRLGFTVKKYISDTRLKLFAINPELPTSLAFGTSLYTEEPFYKNEGMYKGSLHDLFIGNARDACVTLEIDENMEADLIELNQYKYFYNYLMKLPDMYWDIEQLGLAIDPLKRDELLLKYITWDEKIRYDLFKLTGAEINFRSPTQVSNLLFDVYKLKNKGQGTGEEALTDLLNGASLKDPEKRKVVELILEGRRVSRTISSSLMALPDYDGRLKTTYNICLNTGRSSTGMLEEPIRPLVEVVDENGKKKNKAIGFPFQTMTKHGDIGNDIRSMFVAG